MSRRTSRDGECVREALGHISITSCLSWKSASSQCSKSATSGFAIQARGSSPLDDRALKERGLRPRSGPLSRGAPFDTLARFDFDESIFGAAREERPLCRGGAHKAQGGERSPITRLADLDKSFPVHG